MMKPKERERYERFLLNERPKYIPMKDEDVARLSPQDRQEYENSLKITKTRGVGTHSRLGGPNSSRRHHGWHRAENFLKIRGSRSLEMAISEPYPPISVRTVSWLSETCSAFF